MGSEEDPPPASGEPEGDKTESVERPSDEHQAEHQAEPQPPRAWSEQDESAQSRSGGSVEFQDADNDAAARADARRVARAGEVRQKAARAGRGATGSRGQAAQAKPQIDRRWGGCRGGGCGCGPGILGVVGAHRHRRSASGTTPTVSRSSSPTATAPITPRASTASSSTADISTGTTTAARGLSVSDRSVVRRRHPAARR